MKRNLAVTLMLFAITLTSMAQPARRPMGDNMRRPAAIMKQLNLTESQDVQVQKLRIDLQKKQTQLRAKLQGIHLDTKEQFLGEKVDRAAIEKNVKAASDIQEQMKLAMIDHWFAVNALLTPEQQKIWKKHAIQMGQMMREKARGRRQMMMERRLEFDPGND